jgi:2,4-dienoyl-CoA reductase-like NADH-dependent reductase (Old Yellow Enzyme family)
MAAYPRLFSPITIGSTTLANRLVLAPHGTGFSGGHGKAGDRIVAYFEERAKGGVGLIVKANYVRPPSWEKLGSWDGLVPLSDAGRIDIANDDKALPDFARLATAVHRHGTKIFAQLNNAGRQGSGPEGDAFALPLYAPSALACPDHGVVPKVMTAEDIAEHVATYAHAARNMRAAGFDGVELFAAQGYLLSEFLSPHTNRRDDAYGGSLENRMRFLVEALGAIRRAVDRDFVLGVRINGSDGVPGGLELGESKTIIRRLRESGLIDYVNVSGLSYWSWPGWIADMSTSAALFADDAAAIRQFVPGLPTCVASRIEGPAMAERLLEEEKADLIGMVRALIADPELPAKARRGKVGDIRGCTYNQLCVMRRTSGKGLACVQNPALGHEGRLGIGTLQPAAKRRNVVVVGGGPAGLAAAWTAAARGHHVTLFEAAPELGGQNRLARQVRSRARLGEATRWLIHQAARFSVNLKIGQRASAADVLALDPEVVVLAAGSSPLRSGYSSHRPEVAEVPGVRLPHVFSVWDVFERLHAIGPHVLVYDDDPHLSALFAAEHLIDQGHTVTIATPNLHPGRGIEPAFIPDVLRRVRPKGLALSPNQLLDEIGPGWVRLRDRYAATTSVVRPIDAVILATGNRANDDLAPELAGKVEQLRLIGDCLAPRRLHDAILDGERAGRTI